MRFTAVFTAVLGCFCNVFTCFVLLSVRQATVTSVKVAIVVVVCVCMFF